MATTSSTDSDNAIYEKKKIEEETTNNPGFSSNLTTTGSATSQQSITINDPVKVNITVVRGTGEQTTIEQGGDLAQLGQIGTASSNQSITINDPVKVTITVVKGSDQESSSPSLMEKKTTITTTTTSSGQIDDLTNVGSLSTSTPIVQEPDNKGENNNETQQSTSTVTEVKEESTPALSSSSPTTEEKKKEAPPPLTSAAPAAEENKVVEETTITTTSEQIDDLTHVGSLPTSTPIVQEPDDKGENNNETQQSTSTVTEVKEESTPALSSSSPTTEEKKEEAPPPTLTSAAPAAEENKVVEETTTSGQIDDLTNVGSLPTSTPIVQEPDDKGENKNETQQSTSTITEVKEESTPVLSSSSPTTEEKKEAPPPPTLTSAAPVTDGNKTAVETTTTETSVKETKESEPSLTAAAPVHEGNNTSAGTTTNEKSEEAPASNGENKTTTASASTDQKNEATTSSTTVVTSETEKKEESAPSLTASYSNNNQGKQDVDFPIVKGNAKNLTDFQRKKAEYFFHVNLDIENKKFLTWEDVEFYLLFHVTAASKEGSDGGDLEARLSRAARALWEHIHDQVPSDDSKRDKLTLDQFLDTWASIIDYIIKNGKLPDLIQDLVSLGLELHSTKNPENNSSTIAPSAFEQLFRKMNIARPYALMAHQLLSENGKQPLNADRINSLVRAVISSSDDGHNSHFLLPGFFKTIATKFVQKDSTNQTPPPGQDASGQQTSTPQSQQQSQSLTQPQTQGGLQQLAGGQQQQQQGGLKEQPMQALPKQQGDLQQRSVQPIPAQQKADIQQLDNDIRRLLQFYRIDDSDLVEIDDGPSHRLILVHPERPLPTYIQQNQQLLQQIQNPAGTVPTSPPANQQGEENVTSNHPKQDETPLSPTTKSKVTLEERIARGEAQTGPTVPLVQVPPKDYEPSPNVRQVYPPLNEAQQQEQQKQAQLQANQTAQSPPPTKSSSTVGQEQTKSSSTVGQEQTKSEEVTSTSAPTQQKAEVTSASAPIQQKAEVTPEEEEKIVESVLQQLRPFVDQLVAAEIRRVLRGQSDSDDEQGFAPFPFMFGGGSLFATPQGGPPPQGSQQQRQQQMNIEANFAGGLGGASFLPPELLMSMMNDLTRGGGVDDAYAYPSNVPPPRGPAGAPGGVGGFMMFVDQNPLIGGPPRNPPPHPEPRY